MQQSFNSCFVQYLTYISIYVPSINQFHSKTSELSENNFHLIVDADRPPARHFDKRESISRAISLKKLFPRLKFHEKKNSDAYKNGKQINRDNRSNRNID